jgi:putative exporter of polyketide antibiotics
MIPSEGIRALELRRTKLVDIYLYMLAAALTIAGLALIVMDRRDRRAQLLSERETKNSEGKKERGCPDGH